jgi:hypothetical protein
MCLILAQIDRLCILAKMGTLLELPGVQENGVDQLQVRAYLFNGNLEPRIFSTVQQKLFRPQLEYLDPVLREVGWMPGVVITLIRSTVSRSEQVPRVKWALQQPWLTHSDQKRFNGLQPLLNLLFPLDADILDLTTKD